MIVALIKVTLHGLVREPTRMAVAVLAAFLIGSLAGPSYPSLIGGLFAVLFGAGVIGREATSGTLSLAFTRPIKRRDYLLAKWIAISVAGVVASLATIAFGVSKHGLGGPSVLALSVADQVLAVVGTSVVVVFLSAFSRGYSDVGMWVVGVTAGALLNLYGGATGNRLMVRLGTDLQSLLAPSIDVHLIQNSLDFPYFAVVSYCSAIAVAFAGAVVVLNRRELSYAS